MILNFVTEFLYQRFFVFGNSLDTNALAQKQQEKEASERDSADGNAAEKDA